MSPPDQAKVRNRLLRALSPGDYALLQPHLAPACLAKGERLVEPDRPISHVCFLESGLSSFVATTPDGKMSEVGLFGFDGLAGIPVVLGTDRSPHELFMQIGGEGYKVPADAVRAAMRESQTLHLLLLRYVQAFLVMSAQTTVSNTHHSVDVRLGRWLLMAHDRLEDDDIPLTHEYLALMLGVGRPSVTNSLHVLEGDGFIQATRGNIRMRDRAGLEALARGAYGLPEAEYTRLVGPLQDMPRRHG